MPHNDPNNQANIIDWILILVAITFAFAGGATKHLSDAQEKGKKPTWGGLATQAFIGGFSGSLATLYLLDKGFSYAMIIAGSGLAGFGGAAVLRFVIKAIYKYIGSTQKNEIQ